MVPPISYYSCPTFPMRQDRRELSFLAALLLGWGLVAAPVVHRLVSHGEPTAALGEVAAVPINGQGHGHSHGPTDSGTKEHGQGSLEHGKAVFGAMPAAPALLLVVVALCVVTAVLPPSPSVAVWPRVEKSQGP